MQNLITFQMGTRSRIVIRRSNKSHIHLWMHWDGYLSGQGDRICSQLRLLLQNYSTISLQTKVDALEIADVEEDECQNFSAEYLEDFIENRTDYKNDPCDDIEFEYTIDFSKGLLIVDACGHNQKFVVLMPSIQDGFDVSSLEEYLED